MKKLLHLGIQACTTGQKAKPEFQSRYTGYGDFVYDYFILWSRYLGFLKQGIRGPSDWPWHIKGKLVPVV